MNQSIDIQVFNVNPDLTEKLQNLIVDFLEKEDVAGSVLVDGDTIYDMPTTKAARAKVRELQKYFEKNARGIDEKGLEQGRWYLIPVPNNGIKCARCDYKLVKGCWTYAEYDRWGTKLKGLCPKCVRTPFSDCEIGYISDLHDDKRKPIYDYRLYRYNDNYVTIQGRGLDIDFLERYFETAVNAVCVEEYAPHEQILAIRSDAIAVESWICKEKTKRLKCRKCKKKLPKNSLHMHVTLYNADLSRRYRDLDNACIECGLSLLKQLYSDALKHVEEYNSLVDPSFVELGCKKCKHSAACLTRDLT